MKSVVRINGVSQINASFATLPCQTERSGRYPRDRRLRTGTILIVVLVCLVAVTSILFGAITVSIRQRQQLRNELQLEQTYWLLDGGIGTAIEKFGQSPDFEKYAFATNGALENYIGSVDIQVVERNNENVSLLVTAKLKGQLEFSPVTQRSRVIVLEKLPTTQNETSTENPDEETNDERKK